MFISKYTDEQIIAAVKKANSFQDVLNDLGLARGSYTNRVLKRVRMFYEQT